MLRLGDAGGTAINSVYVIGGTETANSFMHAKVSDTV